MTALKTQRWIGLDQARGATVVIMIFYHLCFDLIHFGYPYFTGDWRHMNHYWVWLSLRASIVSSFVFISGISFSLAQHQASNKQKQFKQLIQLGLAAICISIASAINFPTSWIDFGIIHFFFVARLIAPWLYRNITASLLRGISIIFMLSLASLISHPFFDQIPWRWIGFTTHKPITEDYVPLLPWIAMFSAGILLGQRHSTRIMTAPACVEKKVTHILQRFNSFLEQLGRHSLCIYLIHQPILWGIFSLLHTQH